MWKLLLLCFLLAANALAAGNERIENFRQAKKSLVRIHQSHPVTLYCGCRFEGKVVDIESCGYRPVKDKKRANRLEWEHVVPAHAFGQAFAEWREGSPRCVKKGKKYRGRKCAETNAAFNFMEADLYNLWPEIGELNGIRNNFSMAELGDIREPSSLTFGGCGAKVADRKFEPMDRAKGIVARTYMYMDQAYPGRGIISGKNEKLFRAWDKKFPVSNWECERGEKIRRFQGNENPVLKLRCNKG